MIKKKRKKKVSSQSSTSDLSSSFNFLLDSYTVAMEDNSNLIASVLEAISKKGVSEENKRELQEIQSKLNKINKSLDKLGD